MLRRDSILSLSLFDIAGSNRFAYHTNLLTEYGLGGSVSISTNSILA
jgi:hypothetical protein